MYLALKKHRKHSILLKYIWHKKIHSISTLGNLLSIMINLKACLLKFSLLTKVTTKILQFSV